MSMIEKGFVVPISNIYKTDARVFLCVKAMVKYHYRCSVKDKYYSK